MSDPALRRFEFWLPTRLVNGLNRREHWAPTARRAQLQRDGVAAAVHAALGRTYRIQAPPSQPKRVIFEARVGRLMDDDGLQAALKHVRDGLQDCGLIHNDGPTSGHTFEYFQWGNAPRRDRGVRVVVELLDKGEMPCATPCS